MAYTDLAESYVVVTIIVMIEKSQGGEDILVHVFSASSVEVSFSLSGWIWAILDEKKSSVAIIIN